MEHQKKFQVLLVKQSETKKIIFLEMALSIQENYFRLIYFVERTLSCFKMAL